MVKKLFAILLLVLYVPATSGMTINSFYCCGRLASVKIQMMPNAETNGIHSNHDNCCDNTTQFFKVHDAQQPSISDIVLHASILPFSAPLPVGSFFLSLHNPVRKDAPLLFWFHSPPLSSATASYIKNCSFLI